jgi:PAS domain S-box-containing protein
MNVRRIFLRLRTSILVAISGLAITMLAVAYFDVEADREAQEAFDARSGRLALSVQLCLQEVVSASRSIRAIVENREGLDIPLLVELARLGGEQSEAVRAIRWMAFLAPGAALGDAPAAEGISAFSVIAAGRGAPGAQGAAIPPVPEFSAALNRTVLTGKPTVYVPGSDKGIGSPVYLNAIKLRGAASQEGRVVVLALAINVDTLIGMDLARFLAREGLPPIGNYAIRVHVRPGDVAVPERLLAETAQLRRADVSSLQRFFVQDVELLEHESSAELDGIQYRVVTMVSRSEINAPEDKAVWWVLIFGLAATLIFSLTTARIALAREVAEDTSRQLGSLVRSSEARFRNLVESTRDWMWETNADGVITFSSGRVHALLGVTPREIVGKRGVDFGFGLNLERAAAAGVRVDVAVTRSGGQEIWLQCACSRFNDEHGQLAGYRGVCSDITQARSSADRQRVLELELNRMDKVGTLDHVMSMVAHELNQPLAAVASYCGASVRMLRGNPADLDQVISSMNAAASQAQVAAAIVRGIRQFIVHKEPSIGSHGMEQMIRNAISLAAFRLERAGIQVELALGPNLPPVLADEILIVQVLLNLLHNAIDAVSQVADPRIEVRAQALIEEGRVRVTVEDNGPGMSDEELARCLEPYVTTKITGLGLGLSISQAIVESHGGVLKISRNVNRGCNAEFTVEADPAQQDEVDASRVFSRGSR